MHTMFKIMLIVASAWYCCWSMARPAVQTAGNSFDLKRSIESERHDFDFLGKHVIRVGAVDHTGVVLDYSQGGERVAVLAPTDVVSFDGNEERMFGGTSAAAPFVSAALADTAAFLPALSKEKRPSICCARRQSEQAPN